LLVANAAKAGSNKDVTFHTKEGEVKKIRR
jgi:hypothetical protein